MSLPQISILISLLVLAMKCLAAYFTGSLALWSDAIESVVNVLSAVMTLFAVQYAAKPADLNHPYGHERIEYFASFIQGLLIITAAISIAIVSYNSILSPRAVNFNILGIAVNGLATLINLYWAWRLVKLAQKQHSPALLADGKHLFSDVYSSLAVLIGYLASYFFNFPLLDPLIALFVALFIFVQGAKLLNLSYAGLMDEAGDLNLRQNLLNVIETNKGDALEAHDLRYRQVAAKIFIEFHLVVNGDMSVRDSHALCDKLEAALREKHTTASITIHVEPEEKRKHLI